MLLCVFVLWKYFCPSYRFFISNESSKFWPNLATSSLSSSNKNDLNNRNLSLSSSFSQSFSYKPLNDVEFVEKHLDENTIQVNFTL